MPTHVQTDASEMFRSVLDALPQHIAVLDEISEIVYVNRAWKRFGDANELTARNYCVGMNYLEVLARGCSAGKRKPDTIAVNLEKILAGELDTFSAEYPCHARDRKRWFKVTFSSLTAGGRRWATASHENITQLWQTNQDLVAQEQKLQSLVDAIPDPICMLNKDMTIVWSNDRAKEMFGPDLENKTCAEAYGSDPCACNNCIVQNTFTDNRMHVHEYDHTDIDGSPRTFRCRTSVAGYDPDGSPSRVMEIMEDVTAQKASEKEIRVLSQAVEYSPVTVVITDTQGTIEYVNPRFTQVTGYTSEEAIGQNPKILSAGQTTAEEYREMWETISAGGIWQGEFVNKKKNGDLYWEAASISPICDVKGQIIHYVAVKEDITGRKQMIKELKSAKEMAESATRAKSNFLATMSHEIRTPMNAILGMSRLVMESDLDNTQQRYVSNIHGAADALLAIINDILDLTKIEADKMDLMEKEFQLGGIVEKIFNVLKYTAREKGLSLVYRHNHPIPLFLIGDATRISQILMNLVANALKYTPRGEVEVISDIEPDGSGNTRLCIRVKDTGIGMNDAQMKKLFQPFTQLDDSTARKYGGTGLGLSIVKRMVDIMDGQISVKSTPDVGSEFSVVLPLKSSHSAGIPHLPVDRLAGTRALIIGRPTLLSRTLGANLGRLGLTAAAAETISQGTRELETLQNHTFVCLMPDLSLGDTRDDSTA
ncbi:MAG: PAS domain S-box protein, partial [Desulfobacterales bacterium]|nr:PAS domain S-box protein [Desulfobacterales bacterium]